MARPLRIEYEGAFSHITSQGNERKPIFHDERDREIFLDILADVNRRYNWLFHTYCLMNNHSHIVVETLGGLEVCRIESCKGEGGKEARGVNVEQLWCNDWVREISSMSHHRLDAEPVWFKDGISEKRVWRVC